MKLLFDQNISFRLVKKLSDLFLGSKQVRQVGLDGATDKIIWDYARKNNFTIVKFDSDFFDYAIVHRIPPKIIWLRTGNTSTTKIAELLIREAANINEFIEESGDKFCLEIFNIE